MSEGEGLYAGALGPSTIVGSAAFNLLVIIAVCVYAIDVGTKKVEQTKVSRLHTPQAATLLSVCPGTPPPPPWLQVYMLTASCSVLSYVWLLIILIVITPDIVTVGEAVATFVFFFILLVAAYVADKDCFRGGKKVAPMAQASSSSLTASDEDRKGKSKGLEAAVAMVTPSAQPGFDHKLTAEQQAQLPKDPGPATEAQKDQMASVTKSSKLDGLDETEKVQLMIQAMQQFATTGATHSRNAMAWLTGKKGKPVIEGKAAHKLKLVVRPTPLACPACLPLRPRPASLSKRFSPTPAHHNPPL